MDKAKSFGILVDVLNVKWYIEPPSRPAGFGPATGPVVELVLLVLVVVESVEVVVVLVVLVPGTVSFCDKASKCRSPVPPPKPMLHSIHYQMSLPALPIEIGPFVEPRKYVVLPA